MISSAVAKLLNNTIILENSGIIYLQTLGIFFLDWYIVINSYIAIYDKILNKKVINHQTKKKKGIKIFGCWNLKTW